MASLRSDKDGNAILDGDILLKAGKTVKVNGTDALGGGGGGGTYEIPTGSVDGSNAAFVFTAPPILVFRNGVMEKRLGSISTNTFTFDAPPESGDDVEGLV